MKEKLVCFTDGGCQPTNPGRGSFAYVITKNDVPLYEYAGVDPNTTNNRMELAAMIHLLHFLLNNVSREIPVEVYTDSQYVQKGLTIWRHNWAKKKWEGVKNPDLWLQLSYLADKQSNVKVMWVKGHDGNKWNEYVDELCIKALKN